jgi:hypothetical protein
MHDLESKVVKTAEWRSACTSSGYASRRNEKRRALVSPKCPCLVRARPNYPVHRPSVQPEFNRSSTCVPSHYRICQLKKTRSRGTYILNDRSSSLSGQVALQVLCLLAKSRIAETDSSNQGLSPSLSGNQPLDPPAARSRIK